MTQLSHKPDWFLDWSNDVCVIIASGPSATEYKYEQFRARAKWIATNTSYKLAPWADVVLGADGGWWNIHQGLPDYKGLRVTLDWTVSREFQIPLLKLIKYVKEITVDKPGTVGMGGNSGFYAINLAIQFGCKKIILCGFDMTLDHGMHWHGSHPKGLNNPVPYRVMTWRKNLDAQVKILKKLDVQIINASEKSALKSFPKLKLNEALDLWSQLNVN